MGRLHIKFSNEDKVLFERLNERTKLAVKCMSHKLTAQELIDNA